MDQPRVHRTGPATKGRAVGAGVLAVMLMLGVAVACSKQETASTGSGTESPEFQLESYSEVGPNAFTPPVDTPPPSDAPQSADLPSCNKQEFVKELQSRPDAMREWAKVLKIPEASVPNYVEGLQTATLASDLKVTNHGLKDGVAYPRNSILSAGTAVMIDPNFGSRTDLKGFPPPSYVKPPVLSPDGGGAASTTTTGKATTTTTRPTTTITTATGGTTTTIGYPVTRCKCGNPLLPPALTGTPPKSGGTNAPNTTPRGTTPGTNPGTTGRPTTTTTQRGTSSTTRPSSSSSSVPSSSSSTPTITRVIPSVTAVPEKSPN